MHAVTLSPYFAPLTDLVSVFTGRADESCEKQGGAFTRPPQGVVAHSRADLYRAGPGCKRPPGWGCGVATRLDHRADRIGLLRLSGAAQVNDSPERWTDCLSPALLTPRPSGDHLPGSQIRRQPRGSASTGAHAALLWRIYQNASRGMRHLVRSEEHTSELQSLTNLVCRLLLEKKKKQIQRD